MPLPSYEKLGVFYLGREYDPKSQALGEELLYDSRDLTTHAVCIGMTGSGKTGLCLSLLEEAAIDGVPAIAIDPKGDIGEPAAHVSGSRGRRLPALGGRGRGVPQEPVGRGFRVCNGRDLAQGTRGMEPGRRAHSAAARRRRGRDLHAGIELRPAAVDPALVRRTRRGHVERRHRPQGTYRLGGRRPARTAGHRCGPDQESRAHPALGDPRHRVAQGPEPRPRRDHPGRAEAAVRKSGRLRPGELLPGEGPDGARVAGEWPARLAGLRSLAGGRGAGHPEAAVHGRRQAARRDHLDRAPERCRAHVRRDADRERTRGVDAPAVGHDQPAGGLLHGRSVRVLPALGHAAFEAAVAHADEAGARIRSRRGARDAEPGGPGLQGTRQRGYLVHRTAADGARQEPCDRGAARHRSGEAAWTAPASRH